MKFVADRMLGKLARLLRLIGYDAEYSRNTTEDGLKNLTGTGTIFLTRGKRFTNLNRTNIYAVKENYPVYQLKEVIQRFNLELKEENFFSRCLECNRKLEVAPDEDVQRRVPEFVKRTKKEFFICPECRRIYWEGSHRKHMEEIINTLRRLLDESKGEKNNEDHWPP